MLIQFYRYSFGKSFTSVYNRILKTGFSYSFLPASIWLPNYIINIEYYGSGFCQYSV